MSQSEELKVIVNEVSTKIQRIGEGIPSRTNVANEFEFKVVEYLLKWTLLIGAFFLPGGGWVIRRSV